MLFARRLMPTLIMFSLILATLGNLAGGGAQAAAVPVIQLSPTSVTTGATSQVHAFGTSFVPASAVTFWLDSRSVVGSAVATAAGTFQAILTIPASTQGQHVISARGSAGNVLASAPLMVTGTATVGTTTLSIVPAAGPPGQVVSVTGTGFQVGEPVALSVNGTLVASVLAGTQGQISSSLTLPRALSTGVATVTAMGQTSHITAAGIFSVQATVQTATVSLSASSVQVGGTATVTGAGFGAGEPVVIGMPGKVLGTAQSSAVGSFSASVTLPATIQGGSVALTATGTQTHRAAMASITVLPAAHLGSSATSIQAGANLTLTGSGFDPNQSVVLSVPGVTLATVASDGHGAFSATVTMPATLSAGTVTVTATAPQTHRTATTVVTVTVPVAVLTLGSSYAIAGSSLQVSATGFWPKEVVQLSVQSGAIGTITADANGAFSKATVTLPISIGAGTVKVTATGATSHKVANASLAIRSRTGTLAVSPAQFTPGSQVRITGAGFAPNEFVTISLSGRGVIATARAGAQGGFVISLTLPATTATGTVTLTATGEASHVSATGTTQILLPAPVTVGNTTWYFAAGRTDAGYSDQIALLNPGSRTVNGTITFYYGNGQTVTHSFSLHAQALSTLNVQSLTGITGRVSAKVQANLPIAAARTTQRGGQDVMASKGVSAPSRTWYMAEGYTGLTFKEELALLNPGSQAAHVHVTWPQFNGKAAVTRDLTLAPQSRQTIDVNSYVANASHATIVTADQPIVASRNMQFGSLGSGAYSKAGVTQASTTLYFAEGSTRNGFQEYLTILNPDSSRQAQVTAQLYGEFGQLIGTRQIVIDPLHRANIKVNDIVKTSKVSAVLHSNIPIVAERSMYFGAPNGANAGGTAVYGQPKPALGWAFARGNTLPGQSEFELLFNPNRAKSVVNATYYLDNGTVVSKVFTLSGSSRMNIAVTRAVPELARGYHGVVLRSTNQVPFLAEQAIYTDNMAHGAATLGTPVQ